MTLRRAEIVLIKMGFHQMAGAKIRPALVIADTGDDDFIAAPVTSKPQNAEFDFGLIDWRAAGLNVASTARLHKLTVLPKAQIARRIGVCAQTDIHALNEFLFRLFCVKNTQSPTS